MKKIICLLISLLITTQVFANINITVGDVRFMFEDYNGVVGISTKNAEGSFTSLLDTKTFTQIPTFYIRYDSAIYPVSTAGGFKITSSFQNNRATVVATLKNKIQLTIYFDIFPAQEGQEANSIKVSTSMVNLSNSPKDVALKATFDTWLGEHSLVHLVTSENDTITGEYEFNDKSEDKWIQSSNNSTTVRFFLHETQADLIDNIVIANKTLLSQARWGFIVYDGREFHSLNSYNNSGFAVTWKDFKLDSTPNNDIEFYIFTGDKTVSLPTSWPPYIPVIEIIEPVEVDLSSMDSMSAVDIKRINEILETIEKLRNDNNYLNEDEIIRLSAEIDDILNNSRR